MFNKTNCLCFGLLLSPAVFGQGPAVQPGTGPQAAVQQRAPARGTFTGTVYDAQTGRPVTGVNILVDGAFDLSNVTDAAGKFTIRVTPGQHVLRFTADNYIDADVHDQVAAGEVKEASTILSNQSLARQSIDVIESVDALSSTAEAMLTERKLSAVVSDSVGHEELSQQASGDAAGALTKVTGVSVVGQGFVYVRGLGERYSSTSLNGANIPTTEPEKRVVPLDLFPTGMIDSIKIAKTYSPDLPAEFSGGLVQLQTSEFPSSAHLSVSVKGGFNTATTFSPFMTSPGQPGDFWGFGAGARGIPSIIPRDKRLVQGTFPSDQVQVFGRSFSDIWEPTPLQSMRPALDWSINGGGTFGKVGVVGALTFSSKPQFQKEVQRYIRQGGKAPLVFTDYPDFREYSETARLGGVFNVAYRFSPNDRVLIRNTWTHDTDKVSREFSGYDGTIDSPVSSQRLRYIQRNVFSSGIDGEHVFQDLHNSVFHWQMTYSLSGRDEPDLREVFRIVQPNGLQPFAATSGSATRFFSYMRDHIYEPQVDYSVPFYKGTISGLFKVGFRVTTRRRDFNARRFRYLPQQSSTLNPLLPSNQLLGPDNIRPSGFELIEYTRGTDSYNANLDLYAGYAMVDISLGPKWRLMGGFRVEDSTQEVVTIDTQVPNSKPVSAILSNRDPVPSINLIYALTSSQNLRASYSRTVSRPDFRELSPFDFNDVLGGFVTVGNANLKRATIDNYDLRWEMFSSGNQLLAVSGFVKTFTDPIEQTVIVSNDLRQSFVNAKGARNYGFELELRRSLATFTGALREFALNSNFTFVDSNIDLRPEDAQILTSQSRPLLGQSRYVFNGGLQWTRPQWHSDANFSANYVSRKITDVGTYRVPDIYQEPTTELDFVYQYTVGERRQWSYRFEAENLSDNDYLWTQGPFTQREFRLGRTFQVGITYTFF